jgi:hypothetical protein
MKNLKTLILISVLLGMGCSQNETKHSLVVTDSIIYYDSMILINESP